MHPKMRNPLQFHYYQVTKNQLKADFIDKNCDKLSVSLGECSLRGRFLLSHYGQAGDGLLL